MGTGNGRELWFELWGQLGHLPPSLQFLTVYLQYLFSPLLPFEEKTEAEPMWGVNVYVGQRAKETVSSLKTLPKDGL